MRTLLDPASVLVVRLAHRVRARRPGRRAELRAAPLARRVAGVRADAQRSPCGSRFASCCARIPCRCWSAARCSPQRRASPGCSFRTCRRISRPSSSTTRARRCLSQTMGVLAHAAGILLVGWVGDAYRAAISAACRRGRCSWCSRIRSTPRSRRARSNLTLVLVLAGLCGGLDQRIFAVLLTDLFPTRIRFSGVALAFNIAFTVFSGMSPLVATTLIRETGPPSAPALLAAAACAAGADWQPVARAIWGKRAEADGGWRKRCDVLSGRRESAADRWRRSLDLRLSCFICPSGPHTVSEDRRSAQN